MVEVLLQILMIYPLMSSVACRVAYPLGVGKVMGSMFGQNRVIVKDVQSGTHTAAMTGAQH